MADRPRRSSRSCQNQTELFGIDCSLLCVLMIEKVSGRWKLLTGAVLRPPASGGGRSWACSPRPFVVTLSYSALA